MSMVRVKQSCMVAPAEETPRGSLPLSCLDIIICSPCYHTPSIFIYRPNTNTNNEDTAYMDFHILKDALSRALVHFYPLAGRLRRNSNTSRLEINCNGEGAFFIEVETSRSLSDFGEYITPTPELRDVLVPKCDYSRGISSFPLFLAQLTRFSCGGVVLGLATNHQVADGRAYYHFIKSWGILARGLPLLLKPHFDRTAHLAPRSPPQVMFHHLEHHPPLPPVGLPGDGAKLGILINSATTVRVVKFSKDGLNALRRRMSTGEGAKYKVSTFQMLGGHIWSSVCKARGLSDEQVVKLTFATDGRLRLNLPEGYFGNVIFFTSCIAKARDVAWKPFWYAASLIKEAVQRINDEEYLRSSIDYCETLPDISAIVRGPSHLVCPNFAINAWAKLPAYEVDFGWGQPKFMGHGGLMNEGQCCITEGPERDGTLLVSIKLFNIHMPAFEKYVYEF